MNRTLKATAAIMLMTVFAAGCTKPENSINSVSVSGNFGNHDYVDLGLPSGTLWATCNVGADSPECYGYYYAWGEEFRKIDFFWANYKFGLYGRDKYCEADSLLVLQEEDDVAHLKWHYGWCMPTKALWEELVQNTTNIFATLNGVKGRLFIASNGNSLFLPATGRINSEDPDFGFYWSSSVVVKYPEHAWNFYFNVSECHVYRSERCSGYTIRPVHPAE